MSKESLQVFRPENILTREIRNRNTDIDSLNLSESDEYNYLIKLRYLANGFISLSRYEEFLNLDDYLAYFSTDQSKRLSYYFESIDGIEEWRSYISATRLGPVNFAQISTEEFLSIRPNRLDGAKETRKLLRYVDNNLYNKFCLEPDNFEFRVFRGGEDRKNKYGDYLNNLHLYGVDFNLYEGWKGIWTRQGQIYGGGVHVDGEDATYVIVYYDPEHLLGGPGFYDEGALDFFRLVKAGKTLRDLLMDGIVIQIGEEKACVIE